MKLLNRFRVKRRECGSILEFTRGGEDYYYLKAIFNGNKNDKQWADKVSDHFLTLSLKSDYFKIIETEFDKHRERLINA